MNSATSILFIWLVLIELSRKLTRPSWLFIVPKCRRYDGREQIFFIAFPILSRALPLFCSSGIFRNFFRVYRFTCASEIDDAYVVRWPRLAVYNRNAMPPKLVAGQKWNEVRHVLSRCVARCPVSWLHRIYRGVSPPRGHPYVYLRIHLGTLKWQKWNWKRGV